MARAVAKERELLTTRADTASAASRHREQQLAAERATAACGERKRRRAKSRCAFDDEQAEQTTVSVDT